MSINPFLNFFCSIFVVSFPQNHCTSYICYLLIKANNLLADNLLYLIQNVFNYGIKDTKKVRFQIDLITCASMAQNDELKQTIHRYRVVLMDAMKIFLIFFVIFSFRSLIHNQRLFLVMIASQLRWIFKRWELPLGKIRLWSFEIKRFNVPFSSMKIINYLEWVETKWCICFAYHRRR